MQRVSVGSWGGFVSVWPSSLPNCPHPSCPASFAQGDAANGWAHKRLVVATELLDTLQVGGLKLCYYAIMLCMI